METVQWEKIVNGRMLEKRLNANPFMKLNDIVYELLEDAIISYRIPAGTKLNMARISELLNVSRTPVTEALEQLKLEGLVVTCEEKNGYYVFDIPHGSLEDLFTARKAVEGAAAYLCAQRSYAIDLKALERQTKLIAACFDKNYFKRFSVIDQAFHQMIIDSCGNPILVRMYASISKINSYYSIRSQDYIAAMSNLDSFRAIVSQHNSIYRAIELGMPEMAESAVKIHLDAAYALCLRYHTYVGNEVMGLIPGTNRDKAEAGRENCGK